MSIIYVGVLINRSPCLPTFLSSGERQIHNVRVTQPTYSQRYSVERCLSYYSNLQKLTKICHFQTNPFEIFSPLMERRKPRKGSIDELALVKAAAWAWYERGSGSGSEGREVREYDLAMPNKRAPKPSRYKLEAMKESQEAPPKLTPPLSPLSTASNSEISLLDDYEIERISKQLDLYIESSRAEHLRSVLGGNHCARNKVASFSESGTTEVKSKPKNKISRGSWPKYFAAICGSRRDDVMEGRIFKVAYLRGGSRKRM